jgi:hypothetical protein
MSNSDKLMKYLLLVSTVTSLIGIVLMILGYSTVNVTLTEEDIFNSATGTSRSLEEVMNSVRKSMRYANSYYYIIISGLCMGLAFMSSFSMLIYSTICRENEKEQTTDKFMIRNPVMV